MKPEQVDTIMPGMFQNKIRQAKQLKLDKKINWEWQLEGVPARTKTTRTACRQCFSLSPSDYITTSNSDSVDFSGDAFLILIIGAAPCEGDHTPTPITEIGLRMECFRVSLPPVGETFFRENAKDLCVSFH